jgi:hypothetical protein
MDQRQDAKWSSRPPSLKEPTSHGVPLGPIGRPRARQEKGL